MFLMIYMIFAGAGCQGFTELSVMHYECYTFVINVRYFDHCVTTLNVKYFSILINNNFKLNTKFSQKINVKNFSARAKKWQQRKELTTINDECNISSFCGLDPYRK